MKIKKILCLVLCAAMLATMMLIISPSASDASAKIIVDNVTCAPGDANVVISVSVLNNPGFTMMSLDPRFDKGLKNVEFSVDGVKRKTSVLVGSKKYIVESIRSGGAGDFFDDNTIFKMTFDVPGNLAAGTYTVDFVFRQCFDSENNPVQFTVKSGTITVTGIGDGPLSVASYKGSRAQADWLAPEKAGMVFAGWYTDATYTQVYTKTTGMAYPKFVGEKVMKVGAQVIKGTSTSAIRFLSTVDSLDYQKVGFDVEAKGVFKVHKEVTWAYATVKANGKTVRPTAVGSSESTHITYCKVTGIPSGAYLTDIVASTFWVTPDGTTVNGPLNNTVNVMDFADNYINSQVWDL